MDKKEFTKYLLWCIKEGNFVFDGEEGDGIYTFNRKTEVFLEKVGIDVAIELLQIVVEKGWSREREARDVMENNVVEYKLDICDVPLEYQSQLDDRLYAKATMHKIPTICLHD